jgi:hypothetical protein
MQKLVLRNLSLLVIAILVVVGATVTWLLVGDRATASASATANTCENIAAALADGPDSDADPLGYAEAQVLPLRHIATSNAAQQRDLLTLSRAYHQFFVSGGTASANAVVHRALATVQSLCPGVTS